MRNRNLLLVLLPAAGAACAGLPLPSGGGTYPSPSPPPATSPANGTAESVVRLTNRERERAGMPTLARDDQLMRAAQLHAEQMARTGRFEHVISGARYPTPESRLEAVGYAFSASAENISWNQPDAAAAMSSWMRSSGHRANILSGTYTQVGAGFARNQAGEPYYVQVFGRPR